MSSPNRGVLYVGVTSNLAKRVYEHRNKVDQNGFSARHNCVMLVYYAFFEGVKEAITEEKRIKGGNRKAKEQLIESKNPIWKDLWEESLDYAF